MSFKARDTRGITQEIKKQDKIISIDGETTEYYVTEVRPIAHQTKFKTGLISTTPAKITPYCSTSNGVAIYDQDYTIKGQLCFKVSGGYNPHTGTQSPETKGHLVFKEVSPGKTRNYFKVFFNDQLDGLMIAGTKVVSFVSRTVEKDIRGKITASTPVTTVLKPVLVEVNEGFTTDEGIALKSGEAMIRLRLDELQPSDLKGKYNYFLISINGATAEKYHFYDSGKGSVIQKTHHIDIYLTKAQV